MVEINITSLNPCVKRFISMHFPILLRLDLNVHAETRNHRIVLRAHRQRHRNGHRRILSVHWKTEHQRRSLVGGDRTPSIDDGGARVQQMIWQRIVERQSQDDGVYAGRDVCDLSVMREVHFHDGVLAAAHRARHLRAATNAHLMGLRLETAWSFWREQHNWRIPWQVFVC